MENITVEIEENCIKCPNCEKSIDNGYGVDYLCSKANYRLISENQLKPTPGWCPYNGVGLLNSSLFYKEHDGKCIVCKNEFIDRDSIFCSEKCENEIIDKLLKAHQHSWFKEGDNNE